MSPCLLNLRFIDLRKVSLSICALSATALACAQGYGGTWQTLANHPFLNLGAGPPLLLTDGSVMIQNNDDFESRRPCGWWRLQPDANGSYVNGTWTQLSSIPSGFGYGPTFYASAVLADGRVVIIGGEYNTPGFDTQGVYRFTAFTNLGAIYDPVSDSWSQLSSPSDWPTTGDAQCVVLPNGQFLLADPLGNNQATLDPATLTWTEYGSPIVGAPGKIDLNDEEGWTLLPDGTVLTVDTNNILPDYSDLYPTAEKFLPWSGQWVSAGQTPTLLGDIQTEEMGPSVLLPNGTVFQTGTNEHTAIYTPPAIPSDPGTWAAGPDFPAGYGIADGAAALLPNGNVLCVAYTGFFFSGPGKMFEFDGSALHPVANPIANYGPSPLNSLLVLPTGQVLRTDYGEPDIEIYTPTGGPNDAWRPTITNCPAEVVGGSDYLIQGTQFNGLSQANGYGDDLTNATNYPLVRITNLATGHVCYCRTHDHSTMGVATGAAIVSTHFTVPASIEGGASQLEVVANGIASIPQPIQVDAATPRIHADAGRNMNLEASSPLTTFTLDGSHSFDSDGDGLHYQWFDANNNLLGTDPTLTMSEPVGVFRFSLRVSDDQNDSDTANVQVTILDNSPPVFPTRPADITVTATSSAGAVVTFPTPVATDSVDGQITGVCYRPSGSVFPPGGTIDGGFTPNRVIAKASDHSFNNGYTSFMIFVNYAWSGFLSPFPKQQFNTGSTIPIKFMLTGDSAGIQDLVAQGAWAATDGIFYGPYHTIGNFRFDPTSHNYVLNWNTKGMAKGTYRIQIDMHDGYYSFAPGSYQLRTIDIVLK